MKAAAKKTKKIKKETAVKSTAPKKAELAKKSNSKARKEASKAPVKETPVTKETKALATDKLTEHSKQDVITAFAQKNGDTGSPEVQVALSTQKIFNLTSHLELNPKDNHSRRGLLKIISKRRRILHYLENLDEKRYKELIKKLGLKK